jgi:hypothetical protein
MRILKRKVIAANHFAHDLKTSSEVDDSDEEDEINSSERPSDLKIRCIQVDLETQPDTRKRKKRRSKARRPTLACKNIVKNYGRAIAHFAASSLAFPYLHGFLKESKVDYEEFVEYAKGLKDHIQTINTFREVLLIEENDSETEKCFKKLLQLAAEVFIKYFSVNWIFSGKLVYKLEYLKFRGKMLRRVQNPEAFTYIKCSN